MTSNPFPNDIIVAEISATTTQTLANLARKAGTEAAHNLRADDLFEVVIYTANITGLLSTCADRWRKGSWTKLALPEELTAEQISKSAGEITNRYESAAAILDVAKQNVDMLKQLSRRNLAAAKQDGHPSNMAGGRSLLQATTGTWSVIINLVESDCSQLGGAGALAVLRTLTASAGKLAQLYIRLAEVTPGACQEVLMPGSADRLCEALAGASEEINPAARGGSAVHQALAQYDQTGDPWQ